ncbi:MAG: hypothetical protein LHW45_03335 [Candidatus Cloacimonetes bacterium]|nr:hypothetical protein [Candidatus Cloacimonadota bacterium]MDY0366648.1 hypothetical protein [Candidatus Syntrophosphaera sp.]
MKKPYTAILFLALTALLGATKYAGEIFQLSSGVQNQAMGNTGLTYGNSLAAGWWNPALLAEPGFSGVELMRVEHFEGLMQQNQLGAVFGTKTRTSLQINHLGIDEIKLTQLENPADSLSNANRPEVWKTVGNHDVIVYGSLARSLRDNLHLGLTPKLAYRSLAENSGFGIGADLGLLWNAGKGFRAAANLRDFFSTQLIWANGTHEIAIPNLDLELGYGFAPFKEIPVHLALRTQIFAEDRGEASNVAAGPVSADFHAGVLVNPIPALNVMAGWDTDCFTAGLGVRYKALGIDFAWRNGSADELGSSQRLSLSYTW